MLTRLSILPQSARVDNNLKRKHIYFQKKKKCSSPTLRHESMLDHFQLIPINEEHVY